MKFTDMSFNLLRKKLLLLLVAILLPAAALLAQSPVSVNPLTGAANVVIPIANYQRGSIKFPIVLVYNGSGVKPTDVEGNAGISFDLQARRSRISPVARAA